MNFFSNPKRNRNVFQEEREKKKKENEMKEELTLCSNERGIYVNNSFKLVGGYFMRVVTCLWRCDFARPGFVLGRSTRNSTLGHINQWLPVYF